MKINFLPDKEVFYYGVAMGTLIGSLIGGTVMMFFPLRASTSTATPVEVSVPTTATSVEEVPSNVAYRLLYKGEPLACKGGGALAESQFGVFCLPAGEGKNFEFFGEKELSGVTLR